MYSRCTSKSTDIFFFLEHYNSVFCCTSLHCTVSLLNQFTNMPIAWIISISCNLITHVRLSMKSSRQNYFIALFISYSFLFLPIYTPMWVSTVYSVLTRVLWEKSQAYYWGWIRTHDLCNFRAVSYQLDHRDCLFHEDDNHEIHSQKYIFQNNVVCDHHESAEDPGCRPRLITIHGLQKSQTCLSLHDKW